MLQLIYASAATSAMGDEDLAALLAQSQDKNLRRDITGVLIYDKGSFLQVIEGPEEEIVPLFERIRLDPRHSAIRVLSTKTVTTREFGEWGMAYARAKDDCAPDDGYMPFEEIADEQLGFDTSEATHLLGLFLDGLLHQADRHLDGQLTVTIQARTPGTKQRNYLLSLGRSLALAAPDISVGVLTHDNERINYNLHRDMEKGEAELF